MSTATLRGRGWPSLCGDVCERRPAKHPPELLSPWAGFRTFRNYRETQPGTPVVAPAPRPFVSLKCRGAGWSSTVPRTGHSCPWTSRSTHHELGFRTFKVGSGRLELWATWRTQGTGEGEL